MSGLVMPRVTATGMLGQLWCHKHVSPTPLLQPPAPPLAGSLQQNRSERTLGDMMATSGLILGGEEGEEGDTAAPSVSGVSLVLSNIKDS